MNNNLGEKSNYKVKDICELIYKHEDWVDKVCLNLYAATNLMSKKARLALASTIGSRVSEGEIGEKYQTATKYMEQIEYITNDLLKQLFQAQYAECRILSGTMANAIVFNALCEPNDTIMALSVPSGGHISHNKMGVAGYYRLKIEEIPFNAELMNIDLDLFRKKVKKVKPKMVILGGSLLLFPQPVREIREIIGDSETLILFDGAHVSGLIAGKQFPNPLGEGADLITSSTYKTIPGPPGGFIVCNNEEIFKKIKRATFPGITANYHCNRIASLAITCIELCNFGKEYAIQIMSNSNALAKQLDKKGFCILGKKRGFTKTHQVVIDVSNLSGGNRCSKLLESVNIICSKNTLPNDMKIKEPSGLRLGVQEVTRLGMKETEMVTISNLISDVLLKNKNLKNIAYRVRELRTKYKEVKYC